MKVNAFVGVRAEAGKEEIFSFYRVTILGWWFVFFFLFSISNVGFKCFAFHKHIFPHSVHC